ncbi:alkyl/aryl-sulfatase [Agromyces aerolatus]|uniref:alkyl/aryl-sulfatase n=1 Tax=Agromyces sp. LY-1074 TaxID=3074080 RepID=UPI00285C2323|nr:MULTISPECIES: alkyl sulfatase dimerization domain-containing protein [unclassified Agromyces]MDR5698626.1 alkyl sulfatase dimerization domain-containing protein [Agromyces sp. LY-1074]MDR5704920.1 alkyl sulfatase dimerization domain-containing protein [Agromyces sp. LY-1358]
MGFIDEHPGLDWADRTDFENVERGFIGTVEDPKIRNANGDVVWDTERFAFLSADAPATVNPSLWRQSQLLQKHGLFEVTDGIYQVRGLDLSNMTIVEGDTGVIVIDPLVSNEVAAAGLALYRAHRGDRPVTAVIYTHSHVDHFGGVEGVVPDGAQIPIVAPAGFLEHAVSENVYAGTAMFRRGMYHTGAALPAGPEGLVSTGLGLTASTGTVSLLPPTLDITETGQEETLDGVRIVFQLTPGTEAPAEMNFFFPDRRALCLAENATHNLHNLVTLRGAEVRDARGWSRYLNEAIRLFAADADVAFASHHWPTWGTDAIVEFISGQRDLYAYLHDQTLRLLNVGFTGPEIAEQFTLPPALENAWHARGYYGSVSHNVKAVYQRYLGWFDGNPAHLWELPPEQAGAAYVDAIGGLDATLAKAAEHVAAGDLRFAAQLLSHAVFAEPGSAEAKRALADVFEQLGYGAENGTWRNFYLVGAHELRNGVLKTAIAPGAGMAAALTIDQIFDTIAIRVDGPRAWDERLSIDWVFPETRYRTTLSNGALIVEPDAPANDHADLELRLTKPQLLGLLAGGRAEELDHTGDLAVLQRLVGVLGDPDPDFDIVTP